MDTEREDCILFFANLSFDSKAQNSNIHLRTHHHIQLPFIKKVTQKIIETHKNMACKLVTVFVCVNMLPNHI